MKNAPSVPPLSCLPPPPKGGGIEDMRDWKILEEQVEELPMLVREWHPRFNRSRIVAFAYGSPNNAFVTVAVRWNRKVWRKVIRYNVKMGSFNELRAVWDKKQWTVSNF